jgi:hypothetical protein
MMWLWRWWQDYQSMDETFHVSTYSNAPITVGTCWTGDRHFLFVKHTSQFLDARGGLFTEGMKIISSCTVSAAACTEEYQYAACLLKYISQY